MMESLRLLIFTLSFLLFIKGTHPQTMRNNGINAQIKSSTISTRNNGGRTLSNLNNRPLNIQVESLIPQTQNSASSSKLRTSQNMIPSPQRVKMNTQNLGAPQVINVQNPVTTGNGNQGKSLVTQSNMKKPLNNGLNQPINGVTNKNQPMNGMMNNNPRGLQNAPMTGNFNNNLNQQNRFNNNGGIQNFNANSQNRGMNGNFSPQMMQQNMRNGMNSMQPNVQNQNQNSRPVFVHNRPQGPMPVMNFRQAMVTGGNNQRQINNMPSNNNFMMSRNGRGRMNNMNGMANNMNGMKPNMNGMNTNMNGMKPNMNGMNTNLNGMNTNMNGMKPNMNGMKPNMNGMNTNMNGMNTNMNGMNTNMNGMKPNMNGMNTNMNGMKPNMNGMKPNMNGMRNNMNVMKNMNGMANNKNGMMNNMNGMVNTMNGMNNNMNGIKSNMNGMSNNMNGMNNNMNVMKNMNGMNNNMNGMKPMNAMKPMNGMLNNMNGMKNMNGMNNNMNGVKPMNTMNTNMNGMNNNMKGVVGNMSGMKNTNGMVNTMNGMKSTNGMANTMNGMKNTNGMANNMNGMKNTNRLVNNMNGMKVNTNGVSNNGNGMMNNMNGMNNNRNGMMNNMNNRMGLNTMNNNNILNNIIKNNLMRQNKIRGNLLKNQARMLVKNRMMALNNLKNKQNNEPQKSQIKISIKRTINSTDTGPNKSSQHRSPRIGPVGRGMWRNVPTLNAPIPTLLSNNFGFANDRQLLSKANLRSPVNSVPSIIRPEQNTILDTIKNAGSIRNVINGIFKGKSSGGTPVNRAVPPGKKVALQFQLKNKHGQTKSITILKNASNGTNSTSLSREPHITFLNNATLAKQKKKMSITLMSSHTGGRPIVIEAIGKIVLSQQKLANGNSQFIINADPPGMRPFNEEMEVEAEEMTSTPALTTASNSASTMMMESFETTASAL